MKQLISIIFLGVLAFSFLEDAGIISFQDKAKIEISEDFDGEQELQDKTKKEKFNTSAIHFSQGFANTTSKPTISLSTSIFRISYEVEIRPPRA